MKKFYINQITEIRDFYIEKIQSVFCFGSKKGHFWVVAECGLRKIFQTFLIFTGK